MAIGWYLVVSAMIFCIGAAGVMTHRNPLQAPVAGKSAPERNHIGMRNRFITA